MYEITTKSKKAEKQYYEALQSNSTMSENYMVYGVVG